MYDEISDGEDPNEVDIGEHGDREHVDGHDDVEGGAHPEGKSGKKKSHHTWSYNLDGGEYGKITVN